jgi:uncharacterized protein (TIGR03435 family)
MVQKRCLNRTIPMVLTGWMVIAAQVALGQSAGALNVGQNETVQSQVSEIPNRTPAFEVASIKLEKSDTGASLRFTADGFNATDATLQMMIIFAYGLTRDPSLMVGDRLIPGGASWIHSDGYNVRAKIADSDLAVLQKLDKKQQLAQKKLMLQALLADRFKLKVHFENKEFPAYALVIAKNGPKNLKKENDDVAQKFDRTRTHLDFHASNVGDLAQILTLDLGRPVLDKTGLVGKYDFTLGWELEPDQGGPLVDLPGAPIFTAIQEQLGLKLEATRTPVESPVIDHVERPSEN